MKEEKGQGGMGTTNSKGEAWPHDGMSERKGMVETGDCESVRYDACCLGT
jgi:hypothetical protein